jgi:predicted aldo/keto reductase-like oxidoreductase
LIQVIAKVWGVLQKPRRDFYTSEEIGVVAFLLEQKKKGRIRHLDFSAHCRPETIGTFLNWSKERFGDCFEFVQYPVMCRALCHY